MYEAAMDIFTACKNGDYQAVADMVDADGDLVNSEQNSDGHATGLCGSPLMFAVRFGQLEIAKLLLVRGANVNKRRDNRGCICIAIEENSLPMINLLLEVDINITESDFLLALTSKRWEIAARLLSKPFNMFYVGCNGCTCLHFVVSENLLPLAEDIMIKAPRLVTIKNASGKTALTIATENQFMDMVLLIKKYSTKYQLENFKSSSLKKYEECASAIQTAEEVYMDQIAVVEHLKLEIEETRTKLTRLLSQFKVAQKNADQAKEMFEEEIENVSNKIVTKPYNNLLECPICLDIPFHPKLVYQCDDGHILCSDCREKLELCPECRCSLKENMSRNRRLEGLIEQLDQSIQ